MMTIELLTSDDEDDGKEPPHPTRTQQHPVLQPAAHTSEAALASKPADAGPVGGGGRRSKRALAAPSAAPAGSKKPPAAKKPAARSRAAAGTKAAAGAASSKRSAMAPLPLSQSDASEGPTPPPKRARPTTAAARAAGGGWSSKQSTLPFKGFGGLALCMSQLGAGAASGTTISSQGPISQPSSSQQQQQQLLEAGHAAAATQHMDVDGSVGAAAAGPSQDASMWMDKHCPATASDLAVHKKKVEEVAAWLDRYMAAAASIKAGGSRGWIPQVLLVTGPPGCGKSTTVWVLAEERGMEVVEWAAPTPTTWEEYKYQAPAGLRYMSKLEAFDMFAVRCKFAALPLQSAAAAAAATAAAAAAAQEEEALGTQPAQQQQHSSQPTSSSQQPPLTTQPNQQQQQQPHVRQKLVLLDDLPYAADPQRRQQLADSIRDLAATARCPVVVVSTDIGAGGSSGASGSRGGGAATSSSKGLPKDVMTALTAHGATTITFNPIPPTVMTKTLQTVCAREGLNLAPTTLASLVSAAAGDLRNAVQALQVHCGGNSSTRAAALAAAGAAQAKGRSKTSSKRSRKGSAAAGAAGQEAPHVSSSAARDQQLGVYHALGKLLHNKRAPAPAADDERATAAAAAGAGAGAGSSAAAADVMHIDLSQEQQQAAAGAAGGSGQLQLHAWYARRPLQYNPEAVLNASGLDALTAISFLSSNYLSFVGQQEMGEAADVADDLSSAGFLACHRPSHVSSYSFWDEEDTTSSSIQQAAAVSVAARGLVFANAHPAPSSWTPLAGPSCNLPDRAADENLRRVGEVGAGLGRGAGFDGSRPWCSQVLPLLRMLTGAPRYQWLQQYLPGSWCVVWQGSLSERVMHATHGAAGTRALPCVVQEQDSGAGDVEEDAISDSD